MKRATLLKNLLIGAMYMVAAACNHGTSGQLSTKMGGSDRGGGSGLGSTTADVKMGLREAKLQLADFLHFAAQEKRSVLSPDRVQDKLVQTVLNNWLEKDGQDEKIVADIRDTTYVMQDAQCPSDTDDDHDGSTPHRLKADICFSSSQLARFPKWVLGAELVALAAHEHAHHFGYGEDEAKAVQKYIFDAYALLLIQTKLAAFYDNDIGNYRSRVSSGYSPVDSPTAKSFAQRICQDAAAIEGLAAGYNLQWFKRDLEQNVICNSENFDDVKLEQRFRELEDYSIHDLQN